MHRFASAALLLGLPAAVQAHGSISKPTVVFNDIYNKNAPSAYKSGTPGQYTGSDVIRDLANAAGSNCGNTDGNAAVQPVPSDGLVTFDISAVHIGPCEVWLDDTKVASANDCWSTYADKTIPIDYSVCTGSSCQLRWVWLATHNDPWEIFDNCVNVGSGGGASSTSNSTSTTSAPASTTKTPAATTAAPAATTTAPAATTAPATSSSEASVDNDSPGTVKPSAASGSGCAYRGASGKTQFDAWCEANCAMNYCPEDYCEACA